MYNNSYLRSAAAAVILIATMSACTGMNVPIAAFQNSVQNRSVGATLRPAPQFEVRDLGVETAVYPHSAPLVYVANWASSAVRVYPAKAKNPRPIGEITDGIDFPTDVCVDASGDVTVTNAPAAGPGSVSVYAAGKVTPFEVITKGINTPAACAIDAQGNLWVTNFGGGNVTEYLKGAKKPHSVITNGLSSPNGIAIDHSGNLYVADGPGYTTINVQVYSPGSKSPTRTITDGVTSPIGITVDAHGTLYVTNINENNVEEYRSGNSHPFQAITASMSGPSGVTVNKKGRLFVSNYENASVVEFAPGSVTPSKSEITKKLYTPQGLGYSPPLLP